jgi:putative oxidoreductase
MNTLDSFVNQYGNRIGRVLVGLLFLISGVFSLLGFQNFAQYTASVLPMAKVMAILAIVTKIGGGLGLILGIRVRLASYALIVFTLLATIFFHLKGAFAGDQMQIINTLKNIAIIGGLFLTARNAAPTQTTQVS